MQQRDVKERRFLWLVPVLFVAVSVVSLLTIQVEYQDEIFSVREHVPDVYVPIVDEVLAESAIIYDIRSGTILAGKDPMVPTSIASITKLAAAFAAIQRVGETDVTTITNGDLVVQQNTPLAAGDRWGTRDLIEYSLITSSNRGISAVARTIEGKTGMSLVDHMNRFARERGLVQTHFVNVTGLDAHGTLAGSESSARDLAELAAMLIREEKELSAATTLQEKTFYTRDGKAYAAKNTNVLLKDTPYTVLLSKTGFTGIAGGTLIMALEIQGRPLVFVVLNSTVEGRFSDMRTLFLLYRDVIRVGSEVRGIL